MAPRTKRTPKKEFLAALGEGLSVTASAERAGVGRQRVYEWRNNDPEFAAAWDDAIEQGTDHLEDIALKRAAEQSDTLIIFLLKGRRPKKYRDKPPEDEQQAVKNINISITKHAG